MPLRTRPRYGTGRASGRQRACGLGGCCRPTPNLTPPPAARQHRAFPHTYYIRVVAGFVFRQRVVDGDVWRGCFFRVCWNAILFQGFSITSIVCTYVINVMIIS